MINLISKKFQNFLSLRPDPRPFLLALSGGPDSMALFHLLLEENREFRVAHIDHNWRKESQHEREHLAQLCQKNQIPFHLKILNPKLIQGNLEDGCRNARLDFFRELIETYGLQGVILGHHADDQAETVLKRIFEGATFAKLKGLTPVSAQGGLTLLRPLLNVRKKEILEWLESKKIFYFQDATNFDPRFLRTRLRQTVIPSLSQEFGKEIAPSLCRLGKYAHEFDEFMESCLHPFREKIRLIEGKFNLDLSDALPINTFLCKSIVKDFLGCQKISVSNSVLETIVFHIQKRNRHKFIKVGSAELNIENATLILSI